VGFLATIFLKLFTGSTLSFVSNVIGSITNEKIAVVQAQTNLTATEASAVVNSEIARYNAQSALQMAQMTHPIWWVAWCLFVIPSGAYVGLIHLKSIACPFYHSACTWAIPEVPKQIEAWDSTIVLSFFGLAAASSIVQSITSRIGK
jgi:hypothetical protein